ncbi:MAG: DUF2279 domain-containing protein [Bacteroidota bacterium]
MRWWVKKIYLLFYFVPFTVAAQTDTLGVVTDKDDFSKKKLGWLVAAESVTYVSAMGILYSAWYKNYPSTSLHSFNDWDDWQQMDKAGHLTTGYYLSAVSFSFYNDLAGLNKKKSAWIGAGQSLFVLTSLEMFDGFSSGWGFSWSDMGFNTLGCGLFLSQQQLWSEQRIKLKFSAHTTSFAQYRPELLGKNTAERLLKDYNGQTYWLSGNIFSFLKKESRFPKWLNVAVGYGAEGMTGGKENVFINEAGQPVPGFTRYRQLYFSLDADLTQIKTRSKFLKTTLKILNLVKIPFPALEISQGNAGMRWFYF